MLDSSLIQLHVQSSHIKLVWSLLHHSRDKSRHQSTEKAHLKVKTTDSDFVRGEKVFHRDLSRIDFGNPLPKKSKNWNFQVGTKICHSTSPEDPRTP